MPRNLNQHLLQHLIIESPLKTFRKRSPDDVFEITLCEFYTTGPASKIFISLSLQFIRILEMAL